MIINKQGKLVANVAQPTVIFDTQAEYEAWVATLPTPECEADFIVIKGYELAPGGVFEVETEADLEALEDEMRVAETLYLVTKTNKGFRYDPDEDKFVPMFVGGAIGTKVFYGANLAALKAFSTDKKNKEYLYYAFEENMFYRYNDAVTVADFELVGAESVVILYDGEIADFGEDIADGKLKAQKYYMVLEGDIHRMFFTHAVDDVVLINSPYGGEVSVVTTTPTATPNEAVYAILTDYIGFYVNGKQAPNLINSDHVFISAKPTAAADLLPGVCYIVDSSTDLEKMYILDSSESSIIEMSASQIVDILTTGSLPTYDDATFGTLYIERATGTLKAKNPNYVPESTDPAKKDPYWTLGTDIQALIKRIEKLEAISNDVRVLANLAAIETLINNKTIADEDVVDMLFVAKDTKKCYIAVLNPDYDPETTGSKKFLAEGVGGGDIADMMPKLTTAEWKALEEKPEYAIITDAAYDADISYVIS